MRTRSEWFLQPAASLDAARARAGTQSAPPGPQPAGPALAPGPAPACRHAPCGEARSESTALYVLVACLEFLF
ncbi:hypothetical protein HF086_003623 [Spodoptera exigua]|nr:hypothetical protein HF086_003623 [Spodoptera exigua]